MLFTKRLCLSLVGILSMIIPAAPVSAAPHDIYSASLSGSDVVPATDSPLSGTVVLSSDGSGKLVYTLQTQGDARIVSAHLHCGAKGRNGPVVAYLFQRDGKNASEGEIMINNTALRIEDTASQCEKPILTATGLETALESGTVYADVHTSHHADGAIRGQVSESNALNIRKLIDQLKAQNKVIHEQLRTRLQYLLEQLRLP